MSKGGSADAILGMMDAAYFISRKDILDFFNSLLSMSLTKIEQTASGAVACQIMDYMYPGSIPMKRVNWEAKSDFQFIENYKLLQVAFTKHNVQRFVDVDKLIRGKYQDNLEFCQWLKAFFEHASTPARDEYDPISRRMMGKGGKNLDEIFLPRGIKKNSLRLSSSVNSIKTDPNKRIRSSASTSSSRRDESSNSSVTSKAKLPKQVSVLTNSNRTMNNANSYQGITKASSQESILADADLMLKNAELKKKNAELELSISAVESERDFYFDKLRGIEVMLQVHDEKGDDSNPQELLSRICKVLYAKQEDNLIVNDDGDLFENMSPVNDCSLLHDSFVDVMESEI